MAWFQTQMRLPPTPFRLWESWIWRTPIPRPSLPSGCTPTRRSQSGWYSLTTTSPGPRVNSPSTSNEDVSGPCAAGRRVPARKRRHFAAVAAKRHRAPAASKRARVVVEEQSAVRIGADSQWCARAFGNDFRPGTRHSRQQPFKAAFPCHELEHPFAAIHGVQFVMPFGDAQDFVYRFNPLARHSLFAKQGFERVAKGGRQAHRFLQKDICGLRIGVQQGQKLAAALWSRDSHSLQKADQPIP